MTAADALWLASRSPRRRELLLGAGFHPQVMPADIDDAQLRPGAVTAEAWAMALAYLKARRVADMLRDQNRSRIGADGIVLGADTICAFNDQWLGQPRDADDARRMLRLLRNHQHITITGFCLLWPESNKRLMSFDRAIVRVGDVSDQQIDAYIASDEWRGKAGAYNLQERIDAGWPIECSGDPTTVMGLPMRKLTPLLRKSAAFTT